MNTPQPDKQSKGKKRYSQSVLINVALAGIVFAIVFYFLRSGPTDQNHPVIDDAENASVLKPADIERMFDDYQAQLDERLNRDYSMGYVLLYMSGGKLWFREGPRNGLRVDWNAVQLGHLYPDSIDLRIPLITAKEGYYVSRVQYIIPRRLSTGKTKLSHRPIVATSEPVSITDQGELYIIGFSTP